MEHVIEESLSNAGSIRRLIRKEIRLHRSLYFEPWLSTMHGPGLSECKCFNTQNFSVRSTWDKISWTKAMAPQLKTWRLARVWSSLPSRSQNQFSSGPSSSRTRSSQGSSNINPTLFRSTLSTFSIQAIATDHQSGRYDRHQRKRGGTVCAYLNMAILSICQLQVCQNNSLVAIFK